MEDKKIRDCMCGYKQQTKEDEPFGYVYFNVPNAFTEDEGRLPDAYICPSCKMWQAR